LPEKTTLLAIALAILYDRHSYSYTLQAQNCTKKIIMKSNNTFDHAM